MKPDQRAFHGTDRFSIVRQIGAGGMGVVYEAFDRERNERVALKTLKEFDAAALYRFKQEFRSLSEILHPHLIPLYELVGEGNQWFFTMELVENATSLLAYLRGENGDAHTADTATNEPTVVGGPLSATRSDSLVDNRPAQTTHEPAGVPTNAPASVDFDRVRDVFRKLADGVSALHDAGKLHRDLKPSNVLVTMDGRVVILDFGLVANLSEAATDAGVLPSGVGTSHRQVYQSTDRSLTGTVAFMSPEQAAREPLTPASDWYAVGVMLFQVLTGRLPFEGSAMEVLADKQRLDPPAPSQLIAACPEDLDRLAAGLMQRDPGRRPAAAEILAVLGKSADVVAAPAMPDLFVGRAAHLRELHDCFRETRQGRTVVCHVSGRSGAGKSTLISNFLDGIVAENAAVVLRGQCYEQESVPYKALDTLVDALAHHLMTLNEEDVERVAPRHLAELMRVFPVLARVEALTDVVSRDAASHDLRDVRRHAFDALRALLIELARARPLVLCIDDLQWGDLDSAALIAELVKPPNAPQILLLLSYRSEYLETSPCLKALVGGSSPDNGERIERRLDVDALTPDDTRALAVALLEGSGSKTTGEVVEWIVRESGGRPFFVYELVAHLNSGAALGTRADLDSVIWERVARLPDTSRRLLEVIAVAGRPVQLRDVQTAALLPTLPPEVVAALRAARLVRTTGRTLRDEIETFHDRIRESITAHLDAGDRRHYHASLAATLERAGRGDPETLAVHFEGAGEPVRASRYYERAASQAVQVLAFERAEYLFMRAAALAEDKFDRARIHERIIHYYTDMARFGDAYATGRAAVEPFGVRLPSRFVPPLFLVDFIAARARLRGKTTTDLLALPSATDKTLLAAIRIMTAVAKAAYQVRPELCVAVATKIVNLCLRHGNTPDCAIGYMVFGAIFHGGVLGKHKFGYDFGRLSLSLVERYQNDQQRAEVNFVVGYFGTSWLRPATEAEELWTIAYTAGLQTGDLFHTGCACAGTTMSHFMRGVPLPRIWEETASLLEVLRRNRLREPIGAVTAVRQAVRNLRGDTSGIHSLDDETFDEAAFVRELGTYGSRHFAHMYFIIKLQVLYLRGEYDAAIAMASRSAAYLKDSPGMLHSAEHYLYEALALAARRRSPRVVSRAAKRFRKWAAQCPDNFLHKSQVLEGEMARAAGRFDEAAAILAGAADTARTYGYVQIEALATDLASRAFASAGQAAQSDAARARAADAYDRWGATSLSKAMSPSRAAGRPGETASPA